MSINNLFDPIPFNFQPPPTSTIKRTQTRGPTEETCDSTITGAVISMSSTHYMEKSFLLFCILLHLVPKATSFVPVRKAEDGATTQGVVQVAPLSEDQMRFLIETDVGDKETATDVDGNTNEDENLDNPDKRGIAREPFRLGKRKNREPFRLGKRKNREPFRLGKRARWQLPRLGKRSE